MGRSRRWWPGGPAALVAVVALVALLAASCGDGGGGDDGGGGGGGEDGAGTIAEALDHEGDDPVTVRGLLLADESGTYLCSALAESFPPQCGSPALTVADLDLGTLDGVQSAAGVRWLDRTVELTGRMASGVLTPDGPPATVGGSADDEETE